MSKRYTSGVVSSTSPTVNAAGASGVFTLNQQSAAQSTNNWPPYKIEESLRFRKSASANLSRTPSVAGNRKIFTFSVWLKRGQISSDHSFFTCGTASPNPRASFEFITATDELYISFNNGAGWVALTTSAAYRDPSAWYHIVVAVDTTQATSSNRVKLYVNGSQVTAFSSATYPNQNDDMPFNSTVPHAFGYYIPSPSQYFDGYLAETYLIDGQALTPSSFGATDKDGNWSPIAYTGTYGTNGFYVNFRDNTSATTMGYDYSGNGNNWTLNGFNVSTANTTYDIMIDVPEDQADGTANNRGNYCTLNPLALGTDLTEGNLKKSGSVRTSLGTMILQNGKYYFEVTIQDSNGNGGVGVKQSAAFPLESYDTSKGASYFSNGEYKIEGGTQTSGFSSYTNGDVIGCAVDTTQSPAKIWWSKNGTWQGTGNPSTAGYSLTSGLEYYPVFLHGSSSSSTTGSVNFGQRPFAYEPPSGFKTLNTFNLPEPTIKQPNKQFDVLTWTGNGASSRAITGLNFQPDFVWDKMRSGTYQHAIVDAVRGGNQVLHSNSTSAEDTNWQYGYVSSFNSNGFTIQAGSTSSENWNLNGATFVAWNWNAGGSTVTNTSGSISAQVRANPTAGFSVVTYTSPNTVSDETVGHGLGAAPQFIITKNRDTSWNWDIWHKDLSSGYGLVFESGAEFSGRWSTTTPTSSVFTVKYNYEHVSTNKFVAYCFAPIAGYSAFGKYTGNGSTDGPFIYTGFRPRFLLIKNSSTTVDWVIEDTSRDPYNIVGTEIFPNLSNAESSGNADLDILSNGFKIRRNSTFANGSGNTIIYAAFAEMPFKYARAR